MSVPQPETFASNMSTPTSSAVARSFLLKYYTMLSSSPQSLFHFYKDDSTLTMGHEDSTAGFAEETIFGKENIDKKIQSLQYQDCKVSLSIIDSQLGVDNGVLVTAIGHISNNRETPKKFAQTFFLAVQVEPVGFYVKNDIFRFLSEVPTPVPHQAPAPQIPPETSAPIQTETQKETTSTEVKEEIDVKPILPELKVQQIPLEQKNPPPPTIPQPPSKHTAPVAPNKEANGTHSTEPKMTEVVTASQEPLQKLPKEKKVQPKNHQKTEQEDLKNGKDKKVKPVEKKKEQIKPEKTQKQTSKPSFSWATIAASVEHRDKPLPSPQELLELQKQKASSDKGKKHDDFENQLNPNSIYVRNLPFQVKEEQVTDVFSKFGTIKNITLRKGFGFIEFENSEIPQKVVEDLKIHPIVIDSRSIFVEERKKNQLGNRNERQKSNGNRRNDHGYRKTTNKPNGKTNDTTAPENRASRN